MNGYRHPTLAIVLAVLATHAAVPAPAADWPLWRGPSQSGVVAPPEAFPDDAMALEVAWRAPLGPAYSGIALADGRAFTMYSDGTDDLLVALDASSGEPRWRLRVGPVTKGHDGADDGPLSTPVVAGGRVFALSATGELIAATAADGRELWRVPLAKRRKAEAPYFGFATTPLPVDDLIVVQLGAADGRALIALSAADGATRWTAGEGETVYQSPLLVTLAGRRQIVATLKARTIGLDPATGAELWAAELRSAPTATPVPLDGGRLLVAARDGLTMLVVASDADGRLTASTVWSSASLKADNAMPVVVDGHVYGFNGNFLTCLSLADGARVWRSRPPGGLGLVAVGDALGIFDTAGRFVIVAATPDGYRERASVAVAKDASYTWPSFAEGLFYVRDLHELVAIRVVSQESPAEGDTDGAAPRS